MPEQSYKALQAIKAPNASIRSIKRLLREMHIRKWIRLKQLLLTATHAERRLTWAQRYRRFRCLNWRRLRFSDECSIQLGKGQKLEYVFVSSKNDRLLPHMVTPIRCGKQKSKMFWAAFGYGLRT
jgi:hypothetical protein